MRSNHVVVRIIYIYIYITESTVDSKGYLFCHYMLYDNIIKNPVDDQPNDNKNKN